MLWYMKCWDLLCKFEYYQCNTFPHLSYAYNSLHPYT